MEEEGGGAGSEAWNRVYMIAPVTALNNVCACATHHAARRLGITTNPMKMAAYSKFC